MSTLQLERSRRIAVEVFKILLKMVSRLAVYTAWFHYRIELFLLLIYYLLQPTVKTNILFST